MPIYLWLLLLSAACGAVESNAPAQQAYLSLTDSVPIVEASQKMLLGKVEPAWDSSFHRIDTAYTNKTAIYLRKPAYEAFVRMVRAAQQDGISLRIISATRNFGSQKRIWEAKWNGQRRVGGQDLSRVISDPQKRALEILEYSSMPGTSRHHWGTDVDLNALTNTYFATGEGRRVYDWLVANAATYGFCQVYTTRGEDRPHGYQEEKWHWSYMPLARQFLQQYNEKISYADLEGFDGASVAEAVEAIDKYVNGIAPACHSPAQTK